jgi:hypothetical protein
MAYHDLRNATLDQFVQYVFDYAQDESWDCEATIFESAEFAKLYTELFSDPTFLIERFKLEQLERGFWAIQSPIMQGNAAEIIYDSTVPFRLRQLCIESMYSLYDKLFAIPSLPKVCDMWWDGIAYGYFCGNYSRKNEDQRQIQDVMFSTLCRILALSSEPCQYAALHGLGHLRHPDTKQVIEEFLKTHRSFEDRDYARACITGDIM